MQGYFLSYRVVSAISSAALSADDRVAPSGPQINRVLSGFTSPNKCKQD